MLTVLIFAHVPPPHHGQSYMVAQLLEELRARPDEIRVFHVDCRLSATLGDIGRVEFGKVWRMLRYCVEAIRLRRRHGPMVFYYVPAPARRGALYRDWLPMALCRPFFRGRIVFHWHAVGLGEWVAKHADFFTARVSRSLLGGTDLNLVLAQAVTDDAAVLRPKRIRLLANGIPDPCPAFETEVRPARLARRQDRRGIFRVLFLAHCMPEKGLYDTLAGVFGAQQNPDPFTPPVHFRLTVAGQFLTPQAQDEFMATVARLTREWTGEGPPPAVEYVGFVAGEMKDRLLRESDCFCFPTYYPNEVMPVTLIEAMAYGLPIVATRWRAIPEMLPARGCFLVEPRRTEQVAAALREAVRVDDFPALRAHFLANYRREVFGQRFRDALAESFGG